MKEDKTLLYYLRKPRNKYTHIFKIDNRWSLCWLADCRHRNGSRMLPTPRKKPLCPICKKRKNYYDNRKFIKELDVIVGIVEEWEEY